MYILNVFSFIPFSICNFALYCRLFSLMEVNTFLLVFGVNIFLLLHNIPFRTFGDNSDIVPFALKTEHSIMFYNITSYQSFRQNN